MSDISVHATTLISSFFTSWCKGEWGLAPTAITSATATAVNTADAEISVFLFLQQVIMSTLQSLEQPHGVKFKCTLQ